MNDAGIRAIRSELANASDNLARAQMQKRANPDWRSGNDESIDDVIAGYQRHVDELEVALKELGA